MPKHAWFGRSHEYKKLFQNKFVLGHQSRQADLVNTDCVSTHACDSRSTDSLQVDYQPRSSLLLQKVATKVTLLRVPAIIKLAKSTVS